MRPDPDAIGSQVGLRELIKRNFPDKIVKATGGDEPTLTWLATMDQVSDNDYAKALVICVDTANTARVDDERFADGDYLIKIDHHPNDETYGDLVWVDTSASSASEMVARFALEQNLKLDAYTAKLLYTGIVGDTGRFLYPATSAETFRIASELRQFDFDFAALARQLDSMSYKVARLQGYVYDQLEVDETGAARIVLTQEVLQRLGVTDAETSAIVSAPGRIDTVKAWAVFVEQPEGHYRVRLRSKFMPINEIAKRHEGGGHPLASGANAYSVEENETIYQELKQLLSGQALASSLD